LLRAARAMVADRPTRHTDSSHGRGHGLPPPDLGLIASSLVARTRMLPRPHGRVNGRSEEDGWADCGQGSANNAQYGYHSRGRMAGSGEWLRELCTCVILIGRRVPCDMRSPRASYHATPIHQRPLQSQSRAMHEYPLCWIFIRHEVQPNAAGSRTSCKRCAVTLHTYESVGRCILRRNEATEGHG